MQSRLSLHPQQRGCALRAAWPYGFRLVVTPSLVRAYAAVFVFAYLTIHAQNLVPRREFVFTQPSIKTGSVCVQTRFSFFGPVIVYMVYRQKHRFSFTAAVTNMAAICGKHFVSAPLLIFSGLFRFFLPYGGNFFGSTSFQSTVAPLSRMFPRFFAVLFAPGAHTLVNLFTVPVSVTSSRFAIFCSALFIFINSGLTSSLARCFHVIIIHDFHRIHTVIFEGFPPRETD